MRVQSDQLREGAIAEVLITTEAPADDRPVTWDAFIGVGAKSGRTVDEIDASIRALRDEWS